MAKKRKRQDEIKEEREYKPPVFDRREYVITEMGVSKATIIAAIFSIPMGLAAVFVMPVGGFSGGLLAGLAGIGILWFLLPILKIDVAPFKPMQWAGVMSTYFLVFLAVWVVLCNPPFNDFATPEIRDVQVSWDGGYANVTTSELDVMEALIPNNATNITIRAQVTDNKDLNKDSVRISYSTHDPIPMSNPGGEHIFESSFSDIDEYTMFTIRASDANDNDHEGYTFTLKYL
ncbi:MAG: hypothetical protein FP824_09325 [Euryarchaeota archaeon]|nr:hypothetical protein [Euryarchaeota archaeon]MBU4071224.1 hypothetical protein [Candidatus Thermoplasmatota archaeon]MBU4145073.1 hypothetical protein [Candidatus Thermoplasmatota archaeon]